MKALTKMNEYKIIKIRNNPSLKNISAKWFSEKWDVPLEEYLESMECCINSETAVPQWYVVMDENKIIAGLGVIENDFHNRKDLTPSVCAVYVEEEYRCKGIAGKMLDFVCNDMKEKGIKTLYLVTEHTSFYERYNWKFLCCVHGTEEDDILRMYIHREE